MKPKPKLKLVNLSICHKACKDGRACGYEPGHKGPHKPEKICKRCGGGLHPDSKRTKHMACGGR